MISRHIPMRNVKRSSFAELTKYLQDPQNKQERVGVVKVSNCAQEHAFDAAIFEIEPTQRQNKRSEDDKTYHLIISFRPGENPSQDILDAIEERMCAAMGYIDHQRISTVHHDTDNLHIHIAINKIHPITFNIHTPFNDYKIRDAMCQVFEKEYELEWDNHVSARTQSENHANDLERHTGVESFLGWIKRECSEKLKNAQSWQDLHKILSAHGLMLKEKGNGFVMISGDDLSVRASSVDRTLSRTNLEKKFGAYENLEQGTQNSQQIPGGKRYTADPIHKDSIQNTEQNENSTRSPPPQTMALYACYQNDQQRLTLIRNEAIRSAKTKRDRLIDNAKRKVSLRRVAIKLLNGPGVSKQHLYGLAGKSLIAELNAISEQYGKDKQGAYDNHKKRTWADWLQHKAEQEDAAALKELRSRNAREARKQANVLHGEKVERDGHVPGLKLDSVTKEGTVIYRIGATVIRDSGDLLEVSRGASDAGLQAALMMAMHRYGNKLAVNGRFEFKKQIVAVAAAKELNVTFDDPELEKLRQVLVNQAIKQREYLNVLFEDKTVARKAGAIWDKNKKSWFVGPYANKQTLEKWRVKEIKNSEKVNGDEQRRRQNRDQQHGRERATGGLCSSDGVASAGSAEQQRTAAGGANGIRFIRLRTKSKPNIGSLGTQSPPAAKNRLRGMSELDMVHLTQRSKMLLSGNEHHQLEQQRTDSVHSLRRDISGTGRLAIDNHGVKVVVGAEKYITEREQKRLIGFDIPKHKRYTASDKGIYEYAGQRNIDGETLALLKRNDEIIVLPVNDYAAQRLKKLSVGEPVILTATGSVRTSKGRSQ